MTDPTGLFSFDTRFLSKWLLTIDGQKLNPLSVDDLQYFETRFFLVPGTGTVYVDAKLSVIRQRAVGGGFHEELTILNHDEKPVDLAVRIEAGSDFADLFEVKDALKKQGEYYRRVDDGRLVLGYRRETYYRETWISATAPCTVDEEGLSFAAHIEPHGEWTTDLHVVTAHLGAGVSMDTPKYERNAKRARPNMERSLDKWLEDAPRLECDWDAAEDHLPPQPRRPGRPALLTADPGRPQPAGRRSALVHDHVRPRQHLHQPAGAALRLRARRHARCGRSAIWQGTRVDDFRDEDPGRILHEMRYGEMTAFEERPHSPYYGCADATPLYVVLLDEYERWTGDTQAGARARGPGAGRAQLDRRVRRPAGQRLRLLPAPQREDRPREPVLEGLVGLDLLPRRPSARLPAGDLRAPGLRLRRQGARRPPGPPGLEGPRASPTGSRRRPPTSSAASTATSGSRTASTSPLALDADGSQVDALASNNGHLLWSGIVEKSKAKAVVEQSHGPVGCSPGWGVRTLAEGEGRYNPIGYHVGTVWPFDNSFIAWGLRRYGFKEEAARDRRRHPRRRRVLRRAPARGVRRLPRASRPSTRCSTRRPAARRPGRPAHRCCFCGPCSASSPSATTWSSTRRCRQSIGHLELLDIPGRWGRIDAFGRGTVDIAKVGRERGQLGVLSQSEVKRTARPREHKH